MHGEQQRTFFRKLEAGRAILAQRTQGEKLLP